MCVCFVRLQEQAAAASATIGSPEGLVPQPLEIVESEIADAPCVHRNVTFINFLIMVIAHPAEKHELILRVSSALSDAWETC